MRKRIYKETPHLLHPSKDDIYKAVLKVMDKNKNTAYLEDILEYLELRGFYIGPTTINMIEEEYEI